MLKRSGLPSPERRRRKLPPHYQGGRSQSAKPAAVGRIPACPAGRNAMEAVKRGEVARGQGKGEQGEHKGLLGSESTLRETIMIGSGLLLYICPNPQNV